MTLLFASTILQVSPGVIMTSRLTFSVIFSASAVRSSRLVYNKHNLEHSGECSAAVSG